MPPSNDARDWTPEASMRDFFDQVLRTVSGSKVPPNKMLFIFVNDADQEGEGYKMGYRMAGFTSEEAFYAVEAWKHMMLKEHLFPGD